jgi:putative exosortase-associated protein (TIGR04073 family)
LALLAMPAAAGAQQSGQEPYYMESNELLRPSGTRGPLFHQSTAELKARKLARGVVNVVTCVAEVPNQMFKEAYRTSPVTGSVVGAWEGLKMAGKRLAIGLWEVATFYAPMKSNYQPIVEPELIFGDYLH